MDQVEVGTMAGQPTVSAFGEGPRLREHSGAHEPELAEVGGVPELPRPRNPKRVTGGVEIETRDLDQILGVVELGIGRAGEHFDVMAEFDGLACDVPRVDALATTVGIPPVDQPGDAERLWESGGSHHETEQPR